MSCLVFWVIIARKAEISMNGLTAEEIQRLIDLLHKIPHVNQSQTRFTLLMGVHQAILKHIRGDDAATHLPSIVHICGGEAYFQMEDGSYPIVIVIQNALLQMKGSPYAEDFQTLLQNLCIRCNIYLPAPPIATTLPKTRLSSINFQSFDEKYNKFLENIKSMQNEIESAHERFSAYLILRDCTAIYERLTGLKEAICGFASDLAISKVTFPVIIADGIWLERELACFKNETQGLLTDMNIFCRTYGAVLKQPPEETEKVRRQLVALKQRCLSMLEVAEKLYAKVNAIDDVK